MGRQTTAATIPWEIRITFSANQHQRGGVSILSLVALAEILSGFPRAIDGVQIHGVSKTPAAGQCPARPMTARAGHRIVRPRNAPLCDGRRTAHNRTGCPATGNFDIQFL